jgi:hypothetical protein
MKRYISVLAVASLATLLCTHRIAAADPGAAAPKTLKVLVDNTVICKFSDAVLPQTIPAHVSMIAQQNGLQIRHIYTTVLRGFSAHLAPVAADKLREHNPLIEYCEPNTLIKAGGSPGGSGAGKGQGQGKGKTVEPVPQVIPPGVVRVGGPIDATGLNV